MFILWHKKKIKFTKTKFNVKYNLIYKTQILLFINYFLSKAIFLGYKQKSKQGYTCDWTESALNVKIFKIVTSFLHRKFNNRCYFKSYKANVCEWVSMVLQ